MKNVSHHAKQRINQRGNNVINTSNKSLAKNAIKNGISYERYLNKYQDTPLTDYIKAKKRKYPSCRFYFYQNFIFVFSSQEKLITLYQIPEKYIDEIFMNKKRNDFGMWQRKNINIKELKNKNGKFNLTIINGIRINMGRFETEKNALIYAIEYFYMLPIGATFFKENPDKKYTDFFAFLNKQKMFELVNEETKEMVEASIEILVEKKTNKAKKKEIEVKEVTQEEKAIETINSCENVAIDTNLEIEKIEEVNRNFKASVLENNNYKCIGEFSDKKKAISSVVDYYKETTWYNRFLKTKASDFKKKDNKGFFNFLNYFGVAIILDMQYLNNLK